MNQPETNPHLQRLDQLQAARKQYQELNWRLTFLRTLSAEPDPEPNEEELIKWYISNQSALHLN
jgi:hypothetical protein